MVFSFSLLNMYYFVIKLLFKQIVYLIFVSCIVFTSHIKISKNKGNKCFLKTNFTFTLYYSITNNTYVQAVHNVAECIVRRIDNPLLQLDFFFKLSSLGRKFYKNVKMLYENTDRVCLHQTAVYYF